MLRTPEFLAAVEVFKQFEAEARKYEEEETFYMRLPGAKPILKAIPRDWIEVPNKAESFKFMLSKSHASFVPISEGKPEYQAKLNAAIAEAERRKAAQAKSSPDAPKLDSLADAIVEKVSRVSARQKQKAEEPEIEAEIEGLTEDKKPKRTRRAK